MRRSVCYLARLVLAAAAGTAARAEPETVLENGPADPYRIAAVQVRLARQGFSCGLADNRAGPRTRAALDDFRAARNAASDEAAWALLSRDPRPVFGRYTVRPRDLASLGRAPADWEAASRVAAMAYESLLELVSEQFAVSPPFLAALNPGLDWGAVTAGVDLVVLNWSPPSLPGPAGRVEIDAARYRLRVLDEQDRLILSFPCSVARDESRMPRGELRMTVFAAHPDYTFDPANYPESPRAREIGRRLRIPPGPNSPVGVYWIGLNQPGFGIHGTPHPETIGCRESHGCFRLTNRDILTLSRLARAGLPVRVAAGP